MSEPAVTLREVEAGTLSYAEALLSAAGLPTGDVRSDRVVLYVASVEGDRVGVGGLETYGADGLLRSVAVEPDRRGEGIGRSLCRGLESEARTQGVETLYLLTTTAAGFFEELGYEHTGRGDAPERIQRTAEFDELCPSSAACLRKSLDR